MRQFAVKFSLAGAAVLLGAGVLTACGGSDDATATEGATSAATDAATSDAATSDGAEPGTTGSTSEWCDALGSNGDDLKAALALGVPDDMPDEAKAGLEFLAEHEDEWDNLDTIDPTMAMDHMSEIIALSTYMLTECVPDLESMMSDLPTDLESMMGDLPTDLDLESLMSDLQAS